MMEELTTDTVMPVFLSRTEIANTWHAVQQQRGAATPAAPRPCTPHRAVQTIMLAAAQQMGQVAELQAALANKV